MWSQSQPDTQNANDECIFSQECVPNVWGRLFSVREKITSLDLSADEYTIGRSNRCSIVITSCEVKENVLNTISKVHFKIFRKEISPDVSEIYLEDSSSNGTFVNGEKVGNGKKRILVSNDQISLSSPQFKVYVYWYVGGVDDNCNYPDGIRNKYIVTRELGSGACGKVYLVFDKKTCQRYAMKVVQKKRFSTAKDNHMSPEKIMNEVKILKALQHPCIIRVEDIVDVPEAVYIILELMEGGELFDRIQSSKQLSEEEAKMVFYQMVLAVKYLHDNKITHRDLKPENILLATEQKQTLVKVSDFGLSKFISSQSILKTYCGTPLYVAPEILQTKGMGSYTEKIDIWSLGVILYICLSGYPPFSEGYQRLPLNEQITQGAYSFHHKYWHGVSSDAKDLIKKMLVVDPKKRISIDKVLADKWLQDRSMKAVVDKLMKQVQQIQNAEDEGTRTPESGGPSYKRLRLVHDEMTMT